MFRHYHQFNINNFGKAKYLTHQSATLGRKREVSGNFAKLGVLRQLGVCSLIDKALLFQIGCICNPFYSKSCYKCRNRI